MGKNVTTDIANPGVNIYSPPVKQYTDSNTSGGDVTLSLTGATLSSVPRGVFIPYQTLDGAWRLRFNVVVILTVADGSYFVHFSGVVFKDIALFAQGVVCDPPFYSAVGIGYATPGEDYIQLSLATGSSSEVRISGDVELDSKPTWAD